MRTLSFGRKGKRLSYSRSFQLVEDSRDYGRVGGAMLPVFLNDLRRNSEEGDTVEVTVELDDDSSVICSVIPMASSTEGGGLGGGDGEIFLPPLPSPPTNGFLARSSLAASRLRRKLSWRRSSAPVVVDPSLPTTTSNLDKRELMKMNAKLVRSRSSAQRALRGLRFISKTTNETDAVELWKEVEARFHSLAKDGLLSREDFGECIGMAPDSKEFAVGVFDALARRKRQKIVKITKAELHEFWLQISDQSFDARLQIFFDMADVNEDGRITRDEICELIMLSASANKLSKLKEGAEEYAALIMEELDPENLGYIELWQLEVLLLQRDNYMNYSRPLSQTSGRWSQNLKGIGASYVACRVSSALKCFLLEHWQRGLIIMLWVMAMCGLFTWKFLQYKQRAAFQIAGYCLATAKGAAETLKLNMALILLPVCRNILTRLRSTRARLFIPFDDNINFHKTIAAAIAVGIMLHVGNHIACDFPRLINSSPDKFAMIASDFNNEHPTYQSLYSSIVGVTGILMLILMIVAFTWATRHFRRNVVKLPSPFNRLTGFNAFWYSHHLLGLVYILLLVHGTFLIFVHDWYQKTTWMYISVPVLCYLAERSIRKCRSEHYVAKILKVSVLPGDVFSLVMAKPKGFKYKSGQYIFLQCSSISSFEWHPFSITSAPGDNYISVHIRTIGDWTQELKRVFTQVDRSAANSTEQGNKDQNSLPRLLIDGPYGAAAQDYQNYDLLLLVGLGIGATPFISILRDLLYNSKSMDLMDSNTETSTSDFSTTSIASSSTASSGKKKLQRAKRAHFYWVTREPASFEWFKGVMNEVADLDHKGQIEMHNYLTTVYEEGDARSTLITMIQALNHAKHGVDILSGTKVRTHFARPKWKEVFGKVATKYPYSTVGVFYCGTPVLAKELKKLSRELTHKTSTRFEFHKESF